MWAVKEAAITLANGLQESVLDFLPLAKSETPFITPHSIFRSWAAWYRPEKESCSSMSTATGNKVIKTDKTPVCTSLYSVKNNNASCKWYFLITNTTDKMKYFLVSGTGKAIKLGSCDIHPKSANRPFYCCGLGARSIQPKFPEISVQNSMDRFGPTGKVSKKRVHFLRWTTFPGQTGWNFGWMDRALGKMPARGRMVRALELFKVLS